MHRSRDSNLPLIVALLVVIAAHIAMVPWFEQATQGTRSLDEPWSMDETTSDAQLRQRRMNLGRPMSDRMRMAWIPQEDFERLQAREATRTRQPALQDQATPTEHAPLELDPTPPAPTGQPRQASAAAPVNPPTPAPMLTPAAQSAGSPLSPTTNTDSPFKQSWSTASMTRPPSARVRPAAQRTEPSGLPARPTAVPRSDREAALADLTAKTWQVQPGEVVTSGDIEIKTTLIEPGIESLLSARPRSTIIQVTFDENGDVIRVSIPPDALPPGFVAPVQRSVLQWRAVGDGMKRVNAAFTVNFKLIGWDGD